MSGTPRPSGETEWALSVVTDLEEWDYGDYAGRRSTEIENERVDWDIFRDSCLKGETTAQVSGRADRLIARVRALGGDVAFFTHGQFACVLAARWKAAWRRMAMI